MKHLLIVGRPGIGKTTLMKRLAESLRPYPVDGFLTEEHREGGQRLGFWLSCLDGRQMLLAGRQMRTGPRVGPYRVNVSVLEQVAVPILDRGAKQAPLLLIDELGRMELCSELFEAAILRAFDGAPMIAATASIAAIPFLTALKKRKDVELIPLSASNRDTIHEELAARLRVLCAEDEPERRLQRLADRISEMIVAGQAQPIDIEIQQEALRCEVAKVFPGKEALYQLLYESRFRRLWQQFRQET